LPRTGGAPTRAPGSMRSGRKEVNRYRNSDAWLTSLARALTDLDKRLAASGASGRGALRRKSPAPVGRCWLNSFVRGESRFSTKCDKGRIALLQQWFGYCLTADTTQQKLVVAVGDGQNGKSVALDVLTATLGPEKVSDVRLELFAQRFQLTMTLGKLANISYDTGKIDESAEATIKEFTGGDRMYFDRKGITGVTAYPTARLILATNHEPRFADRSNPDFTEALSGFLLPTPPTKRVEQSWNSA
jgi:uncharacterized protein DUF5906